MSIGLVPASTPELLDRIPPDQVLVLLLRHAAREPLPPGLPGDDVPLTAEGRASARALGAHIGARLRTLRTSPVLRCVETARLLGEGAGGEVAVVEDTHLGGPGVYVEDGARAWSTWLELGHTEVMARLVAGDRMDGLAEPRQATSRLVQHLLATAGGAPGVHVFVTHDSLVAPAAAHRLGRVLELAEWPEYLEALALVQGPRVTAVYRGWERIQQVVMDRTLPESVDAALQRGREAYRGANYKAAVAEDELALKAAEALGSQDGIVRAARLLGVATYRLGDAKRSAELLGRALELAEQIGWEREALLTCNHLGATLRRLGRIQEAHDTLRKALERADPHKHLEVRARLLGSLGAGLDDLGEEQAAAEHYARYEELLGLLHDPARLANARGLVSRAARLRGDLPTALSKAQEEQRLGAEVGHPTREGRGWMHIAQARAELGEVEQAEQDFAQAAKVLEKGGDPRASIGIATARGRFYLERGNLQAADEQANLASEGLRSLPDEDEHAGRVKELCAEVAASAGLHGESLWQLSRAMEHHLRRFEPISDPALRHLTQGRRRQLVALAQRLRREAGEVERETAEQDGIDALLRRLDPEHQAQPATEPLTPGEWRRRVRQQAQERWERLLPGAFSRLSPESQSDLVLSDLVYQGPVDDLGRSLGLVFVSIERELRRVVGTRLGRGNGHKPGLGTLVNALLPGSPRAETRELVDRLVGGDHKLELLGALKEAAPRVDGERTHKLIELRNDIAHGNPLQLTRLDVDAVRRVLVLGPKAVLPMVARLPTADHADQGQLRSGA